MASLEKDPCVRGLSFTSFLILPFQRITRLKLLVQVRVAAPRKRTSWKTVKQWWDCGNVVLITGWFPQNILKKVEEASERETNAIKAHQRLEQVASRGRRDCFYCP